MPLCSVNREPRRSWNVYCRSDYDGTDLSLKSLRVSSEVVVVLEAVETVERVEVKATEWVADGRCRC